MASPSAECIWLKHYPPGVPAEIDVGAYASLADLLEKSCDRFRKLPAFENLDTVLTYDDLDRLTQDFASYLQNVLGFQKGDRVAVMMPNLLQYPVVLFGCLRAGMTVVNVNPLYTPRELEYQLKDSGARAIVVAESAAHVLQQALANTRLEAVLTTQIGDLLPLHRGWLLNARAKYVEKTVPKWRIRGALPLRTALARGKAQPYNRVTLTHQDIAFLQYTGGTTGLSKGAVLTHGNVAANVLQEQAWFRAHLDEGKETVVTALPLYHIFALTVNCMVLLSLGGKNLLIANPRDMESFVQTLAATRFTALTGVNTLFAGLLNSPGFDLLDFSGVKFYMGGGAAVQKAVAERWKALTGKTIIEGYGLTETSPVVSTNPLTNDDWNGKIGLPLPSTLVSIRDDANREVPLGQPGELCVKGPQVMRTYWQKPEETAKVFTPDGFLKTGDIATMDERGYLAIVDRKKDMILVSGFNVFPNEVEAVVALHPGVLECACIGVPDEKSGEAVMVFVVKNDPALAENALREHCKQQLTGYKLPKHIRFCEALPKSNVGKILRKDLRKMV